MSILPKAAQPLLHSFAGAFTRPTFKRFLTLMLGAVLTTGRRTITNLLRAVRGLAHLAALGPPGFRAVGRR